MGGNIFERRDGRIKRILSGPGMKEVIVSLKDEPGSLTEIVVVPEAETRQECPMAMSPSSSVLRLKNRGSEPTNKNASRRHVRLGGGLRD